MGRGWRRAFCTAIPPERETITLGEPNETQHKQSTQSPIPSPRSCVKLGFLSSSSSCSSSSSSGASSNPSTPRLQSQIPPSTHSITPNLLRCRTTTATDFQRPPPSAAADSPKLQRNSTTPKFSSTAKSPRLNSSSPRSPLKFSIFKKNSLGLSRNNCGVCLNSVKSGKGTAIFTAECGHAFHFPCIAAHVRGQRSLACPVCAASWRDVPLLSPHQRTTTPNSQTPATRNCPTTPPDSQAEQKSDKSGGDDDGKVYDDDEPLLSVTAGARFVPIPEADENDDEREEEDEKEEFQGFFVDPSPLRRTKSRSRGAEGANSKMRNVEVKVLPESALVSVGRGGDETYAVALRVKAPPPPRIRAAASPLLDPSRRAPIDLVTVLDVSESMSGAKLQILKRAMRLVVSSLGSADRLSIVAFAATPERLLPLKRMTAQGQRMARQIIDGLACGQGARVADALKKATKVLEDRREKNPVATVILLSDGHDDERARVHNKEYQRRGGSADPPSTRFAHVEIPVQAFGFGGAEPAEDAFARCVGGLLSVVAQDLRLQLMFGGGSAQAEISAVYSCNGRPTVLSSGLGSVRLGDLYAEEERELLVELKVPPTAVKNSVAGDGPHHHHQHHHVMKVRCSYKDPASQELVYGSEQVLVVAYFGPTARSPTSSSSSSSSNVRMERLRSLFITARAVAESRRLVEHSELWSAEQLLASARGLLVQTWSAWEWAEEYVRCLEAELGEVRWRRQRQQAKAQRGEREAVVDENGEPLTPTSAWRAAERLAKVAMMKKSMNSRVGDLHGFENARF